MIQRSQVSSRLAYRRPEKSQKTSKTRWSSAAHTLSKERTLPPNGRANKALTVPKAIFAASASFVSLSPRAFANAARSGMRSLRPSAFASFTSVRVRPPRSDIEMPKDEDGRAGGVPPARGCKACSDLTTAIAEMARAPP